MSDFNPIRNKPLPDPGEEKQYKSYEEYVIDWYKERSKQTEGSSLEEKED